MADKLPGDLPEGWFHSNRDEAARLGAEFLRELTPGHLLDGRPVSVVAHREGTDDVLFRHDSDATRFTVIHLTWLGRQEIDKRFPTVEVDGTFEDFLKYEESFLGR